MNKLAFALILTLTLGFAISAQAEEVQVTEPFTKSVLVNNLDNPWGMVWGPDNQIWVTERLGKRVTRIDPNTGAAKIALTIDEAFTDPGHQGVLGLALAPDFLKQGSKNYAYIYYSYQDDKQNNFSRIARYEYDATKEVLANPTTIIEGIPAGNDHMGGRLIFGPDGKLYLSHGELGHNQFGNFCKPIEAQRLPTQQEIINQDYSAYLGKTFRINPDGSIPEDNPVLDGVKSHVFTYGHRNPQGLVFVGNRLFECEHGPSSDDEINLLEAGGNYGWPHVAGFIDDQAYAYANYSAAPNCESLQFDPNYIPAGVPVQKETGWQKPANFKEPSKTFFTVPNGYNYNDANCKDVPYMCWPTVAPSSLAYYPADGPIKTWRNSLLMTTLKSGALYRLPMNADQKYLQGDVNKLFQSQNRYRDVLVSPDGLKIYIATDKEGYVRDLAGAPADKMENPGAILVFTYTP